MKWYSMEKQLLVRCPTNKLNGSQNSINLWLSSFLSDLFKYLFYIYIYIVIFILIIDEMIISWDF